MPECFPDPRHVVMIPPSATRDYFRLQTRRQFFGRVGTGLGSAALSALLGNSLLGAFTRAGAQGAWPRETGPLPHMAPRAKRAIYLFMGGAPSQVRCEGRKGVP